MKYILEKTDLGVHYYSAVAECGKIEVQVAVHESGLINKISLTAIPRKLVRIPVSKAEFDAAFKSAYDRFRIYLDQEHQAMFAVR